MSNDNVSKKTRAKATAALIAQCNAYKEGVDTFRAFLAKHRFTARDPQGREVLCLAAKDVALMLDCITADAEDAADGLAQVQPAAEATQHKGAVA